MGDFSRGFHRPDAGSHTVEGNVSGTRAMMLEKKRQADQAEYEAEKLKRQRTNGAWNSSIDSKFQPARIGVVEEQAFKDKTVGLVSASQFKNAASDAREEAAAAAAEKAAKEQREKERAKKKAIEAKQRKKEKKKMASLLSFMGDEEEEEEEAFRGSLLTTKTKKTSSSSSSTKMSKKDPTIDTSFLPDIHREEQQEEKRKQLELDWKNQQERIQKEALEITYSYWDGSGHRRTCTTTKGASIGDFLEVVRKDLCGEFRELTTVASDALLYVKEDLILPHDITFYDLIVTKARGKSGPLFHFDVHEDVRLGPLDSRVEKDESHPGKVVERRWYERNKHIFPASRWELYDPAKDYGRYTIHGGEVNTKKK